MASRTPAMIEAQKAYAAKVAKENLAAASQTASIQATPPGYITGFKVVLTPEYKIDIYPGCANVAGQRVELKEKYTLRPEDESIIRLSASWWYLYLDRAGKIYGDVLAPTYDSTYMAYNHPNRPWRNIGRYFVGEDHLTLFASNWQQASEQTVYVAPKNFGGIANYYCTGTDDQILINAAIQYLHEAYNGGDITILSGIYKISNSIYIQYDNIMLMGQGDSTKLAGENLNKVIYNNAVTNKGIGISKLSITSTGTETNLLHIKNSTGCRVDEVTIYDSNIEDGIQLEDSTGDVIKCIVRDCTSNKTSPCAAIHCWGTLGGYIVTGNKIYSHTSTTTFIGISIAKGSTVVTNNNISNVTTSGVANYIYGIYLSDPNVVCSGNTINTITNTGTALNAYGIRAASNYATVTNNQALNGSGYGIKVTATSNQIASNYCYNNGSDAGIANTNGHNFSDAGTDTQVYSNSWQQPVASQPSAGTWHIMTPISILTTASATTATTYYKTYTSTQIPVDTKAITVSGFMVTTGTGYTIEFTDITSTRAWTKMADVISGQNAWFNGSVPISSTMGHRLIYSSTTITAQYDITGYLV